MDKNDFPRIWKQATIIPKPGNDITNLKKNTDQQHSQAAYAKLLKK